MSRSLKEYLLENADRLQIEKQKSVRRRDEWIAAVDRLRSNIRNWLYDSDPGHLFTVEEPPLRIVEEGIGSYEVKGLKMILGPRVIELIPVSRAVVGPWSNSAPGHFQGARGRADLTNGLKTYMLYRLILDPNHPVDSWMVFDRAVPRTDFFDQGAFERVVQSLLE